MSRISSESSFILILAQGPLSQDNAAVLAVRRAADPPAFCWLAAALVNRAGHHLTWASGPSIGGPSRPPISACIRLWPLKGHLGPMIPAGFFEGLGLLMACARALLRAQARAFLKARASLAGPASRASYGLASGSPAVQSSLASQPRQPVRVQTITPTQEGRSQDFFTQLLTSL